MTRSLAKDIGTAIEADAIGRVDLLSAVDDTDADWHDATATGWITAGVGVRLSGLAAIAPESPVEIKACKTWVPHCGGRRRGRWYINQASHERLLDAHGVYYLLVHDSDGPDDLDIVHEQLVPSRVVDDAITNWTSVDTRGQTVARVPWSRLLDPNTVKGGGAA